MSSLSGFGNLAFMKETFKMFSLDSVAYGFVLLLLLPNILLASSWFWNVISTTGATELLLLLN